MAIPSFYHPTLSEDVFQVELDPAEAAHAVKARRLKAGQKVRLFDGNGLQALGELSAINRRSASVMIAEFKRAEIVRRRLSIAVAIPKGDRQKVMLDMLTQLGVTEIIPLICEYSVSKVSNNTYDKWQRVVIEAAKQSQNPFLPIIGPERSLDELLTTTATPVLFANADGQVLSKLNSEYNNVLVLVGPEGGFSEREFDLFRQMNISSIALGGHILRTEVAAIAVAAQFNLINRL